MPTSPLSMPRFPYASSAIVTIAYPLDEVSSPLDGYGYVVPSAEGSDVLACTWTSSKWAGRAPEGVALLRVYAGRFGGRDVTADSDDELVALARAEVRLLGIAGEPVLTRVQRWPRGMPQYVLGHPGRLEKIDAALEAASRPGACRRRVPRGRYPGLHPVGRAGGAVRGAGSRLGARMRHEASEALFAEASELLPGGVSSPVRAFRAVGGVPVFVERGEGAYLYDVDGNRYVDYVLSFGPLILGHAHPRVVAALEDGGASRDELRRADPARGRARAAHPGRDAVARARPLRQLGHRGDDERAPARARLHRSHEDREVRRAATTGTPTCCSSRPDPASPRSDFPTLPA